MGILFYFNRFSYKVGGVMRSGSQNFGFAKTNEMFGVERMFEYDGFIHAILSTLHLLSR